MMMIDHDNDWPFMIVDDVDVDVDFLIIVVVDDDVKYVDGDG